MQKLVQSTISAENINLSRNDKKYRRKRPERGQKYFPAYLLFNNSKLGIRRQRKMNRREGHHDSAQFIFKDYFLIPSRPI